MSSLFITDIGTLVLPRPWERGMPAPPLELRREVWLEVAQSRIVRIGQEGNRAPETFPGDAELYSAEGGLVTPGFVDAHTHPAFVSWRAGEFGARCRGATYQEIAEAGGGILSTVRSIRNASFQQLTEAVTDHLRHLLALGVTTLEAKSGYGLTTEDELKQLRAIQQASVQCGLDISLTLLAAHSVPPEFQSRRGDYVELVCRETIPAAVEAKLAECADVFVEEGAFTVAEARRIFEAAAAHGLGIRIHADQFHTGEGAALAAEFNAWSADHLDWTDEAGIAALAGAGVVGVLLPGPAVFLGQNRLASARRMVDGGMKVALATDFNPGTCPSPSLPLMMTLAGTLMKMTPDECWWAATLGGAEAIRRADRVGTLLPGWQADFCLWDAPEPDYVPYRFGAAAPRAVFKRGRLAAQFGKAL